MELQQGLGLSNAHVYGKRGTKTWSNGRGSESEAYNKKNKRSFDETFYQLNEQTLPLLSWNEKPNDDDNRKNLDDERSHIIFNKNTGEVNDVVGWPPINIWRRKHFNQTHEGSINPNQIMMGGGCDGSNSMYVKVKMDGAAVGSRIDLCLHNSYQTLTNALISMFGHERVEGTKIVYQDKEGDWLLVGDIPWTLTYIMEREESKQQLKKGHWTPEEDLVLKRYIETHGEGNWTTVSKNSGLMRGGKSCRMRWMNYLRPNLKHGNMSQQEEDLIIRMHKLVGNRWALIAGRIHGRTDNEIKNYWNTYLSKKKADDLEGELKVVRRNANDRIKRRRVQHTSIHENGPLIDGYVAAQSTVVANNNSTDDWKNMSHNVERESAYCEDQENHVEEPFSAALKCMVESFGNVMESSSSSSWTDSPLYYNLFTEDQDFPLLL